MKNRFKFLFFVFIAGKFLPAQNQGAVQIHFSSDSAHNSSSHNQSTYHYQLEIPAITSSDEIIHHLGYTLKFNAHHKQADWVAYELTSEETIKITGRTNKFLVDPMVHGGTATNNDYAHSGYDRGHLAPAADMGWSVEAEKESFYFSNMSPQLPSFNRGIWKKTEELVRNWAIKYNSVYIITGPVLNNHLPSIGSDNVSVPEYFYKVILDGHDSKAKGIAFIIPNEGSTQPLQYFAVTIDSVQQLTHIDFFPLLPDVQEKQIETNLCIECWTWNNSNHHNSNHTSPTRITHPSAQNERTIYTGPRGGKFYFARNGRKVYIKK